MRHATGVLLLALLLLVLAGGAVAEPDLVAPYESADGFVPQDEIDVAVLALLRERGVRPSPLCSDATFVRRAHLDATGTLPEPSAVLDFLRSKDPDRRTALVDDLLARPGFAEYQALRWADALRVKSEFPVNLWPDAVRAYDRWIRDALRQNLPYDRFVRELLTSSGSCFRVAPVNFWRATADRSPAGLAAAVALTFLGERIERWPEDRRAGLAALCSRVAFKRTQEWKEEVVHLDPTPAGPLDATLPDGTAVRVPPDEDPRRVLADWLLGPGRDRVARAVANRVWSWLLGRGVVHEPDDLRPDEPSSHPPLLDVLARTVVDSGWDLRALYRRILRSRTYQGSPIPRHDGPEAESLFACYRVRPLDAEVLRDALVHLDGVGEEYASQTPEPWTFVPRGRRSILLADGSISSPFLETFGRPARDTGLEAERPEEPSEAQRLFLLNSSDVRERIARSPRLRRLVEAGGTDDELVRWLYVALLARDPTEREASVARAHLATEGLSRREAAHDLAWALVNSKEFLYQH